MVFDFSEFSYGHAVIKEVEDALCVNAGQTLVAAPYLPTLRHERSVGYDVKIETNASVVVLQFKLGERIGRQHPNSPTWWQPGVGEPHYRITFRAGHHQLCLMKRMEKSVSGRRQSAIVRYIAPAFHTMCEFNRYYTRHSVVAQSYACRPSRVPADGADHYLVHVRSSRPSTTLFSEPIDVSADNLALALDRVATARSQEPPADRTTSRDRVPEIVTIIERTLRDYVEVNATSDEFDLGSIERRAASRFEGRPDLEHASIAIEIGNAVGLAIGFTATLS